MAVYQVTYFIPPTPPSSLRSSIPTITSTETGHGHSTTRMAAYDLEQLGLAWVLYLNQPYNHSAEIFMNSNASARRWVIY